MKQLPVCPNCGKEKKFGCSCEYGSLMKVKMEPTEKQKGFFHKKFCPKCGASSNEMHCKKCGFSFSLEDFWIAKFW
ncbi:MAG: hypothetical protein OEV78_02995 [Spirochaetia bacterium]|nr:hypothetical protein [Spirochaetia bacterium]